MLCIVFSGADFPKKNKLAALHAAYRDAIDVGDQQMWGQDCPDPGHML